jgi:predicted ATPase
VGGAEVLLHFGVKRTQALEAKVEFTIDQETIRYFQRLIPAAPNGLIFSPVQFGKYRNGTEQPDGSTMLWGHRETMLTAERENRDAIAKIVRSLLARCRVFHFHDTSETAAVRRECYIEANRSLYPDAGNLPAMLYLYKKTRPTVYRRILGAVQLIAPLLDDFVLEPRRLNPREILLNWRMRGSDYELGPHQLSDGTLRGIALCTLLLQPEEDLPALIILDEPELGLHPTAMGVLASLLHQASQHCQVLVATQSVTLVEHFDPGDIIVVNNRDGSSTFERLDTVAYKDWLNDYTVGELWERNVIGGGPY